VSVTTDREGKGYWIGQSGVEAGSFTAWWESQVADKYDRCERSLASEPRAACTEEEGNICWAVGFFVVAGGGSSERGPRRQVGSFTGSISSVHPVFGRHAVLETSRSRSGKAGTAV